MIKRLTQVLSVAIPLMALPFMVSAQQFLATGGEVGTFLNNVLGFVNNVIIPFLLGIGFLFFVYGVFKYFILGGADEDSQKEGKQLILYAVIGFVIIFIFWGLVSLLTRSTGLNQQTLPTNLIPRAPTIR